MSAAIPNSHPTNPQSWLVNYPQMRVNKKVMHDESLTKNMMNRSQEAPDR